MASSPAQALPPDEPARIVPTAIKPPPPTSPSSPPTEESADPVDKLAAEQQELATLLWEQCAEVLRRDVNQAIWDGFLSHLAPVTLVDEHLTLAAPNQTTRDRVVRNHLASITGALTKLGVAAPTVDVVVKDHPLHQERQPALPLDGLLVEPDAPNGGFARVARRSAGDDASAAERHPASAATTTSGITAASPVRDSGIRDRDTFDTFVVGPSNRFTASAAQAIAEEPGKKYNPLFIYSDSGLGKTHLLHAIGNYLAASRPSARCVYVSSETFLNDFVEAIRKGEQLVFKQHYRNTDVLLLDDVQFIEGKETTQEELFHTFNVLHNRDSQIVITCDRPPREVIGLDYRIRTRFEWGLITDIQSPELETRIAILRMLSSQTDVADAVLDYIAEQVTDNVRELEGAYTRVMAYANLTHAEPSLDLAQTVLSSVNASAARPLNPNSIIEHAAELFGTTVDALQGAGRNRDVVTARHIAMYVLRELTDLSSSSIGSLFGRRDHSTVLHACNKIKEQMPREPALYQKVQSLFNAVRHRG